ncbi:radical SAM protein [uncultured Phascolarctobacterium sp.]|uniref:elongator complex protein 3 n=1 Tax=Phascolarctobacterium sp. TaxID=2049039 RepID=UPI0025F705A5|nr:radical SAM protein [uncultured Phascolarctobacterium sp.]
MAIIPIFIPHAGCPHQCVFCNQKTISGQQVASADAVRQQIARYLQWVRPDTANEAAFYGGSFTGLPADLQTELFQPVDKLLADGVIGSVRLSTRPDYIDAERLALLKRHGVKTVELGVQSLDDKVLAAAERGHQASAVYDAVALLKQFGFSVGLQLMVGMPGQSFASLRDTIDRAISLKPSQARIYPLLVIKGTPLAAAYASGTFTPLTLDAAVEQSAYAYRRLTQAGIKVIRVGLQADEELCSAGNIIAGPFHPAFGELVQSHLLYQDLTPKLQALLDAGADQIRFSCPVQRQSQLRGLKNSNLQRWQQLATPVPVSIVADTKANSITVSGGVADE